MSTDSYVLVTGGVGFIGSHTSIVLLQKGYNVLVIDNFSNTSDINVKGLETLYSNLTFKPKLEIKNIDLRDSKELDLIFKSYKIDSIIHFAALKAVGESVEKPLLYYDNNIVGIINLLQMVANYGIKKFIFSSSCTVYGSEVPPFDELETRIGIGMTNPYGKTKYMCEEILWDMYKATSTYGHKGLSVISLRYFNPIGCHPSGLIGEVPIGVPNNLFPYILDVAEGKRTHLNVFGYNWNTLDGTALRDYIHVMDLAEGHYEALKFIETICEDSGNIYETINLGTGYPTSVLELVHTFEAATKVKIPYKLVERRSGDVESSYANTDKSERLLGWKTTRSLKDMCIDGWNFRNKIK